MIFLNNNVLLKRYFSHLQNLISSPIHVFHISDEMGARAEQFSRKAAQVRRNMWWRSVRLTIAIIGACMLFVVGVIG